MSLDIFKHIIVNKMTKIEFEKIVQANESDLQQIRSKYFPLIEEGIITGYNLYPGLFDCSKGKFFLNYLHSDLGKKDRH